MPPFRDIPRETRRLSPRPTFLARTIFRLRHCAQSGVGGDQVIVARVYRSSRASWCACIIARTFGEGDTRQLWLARINPRVHHCSQIRRGETRKLRITRVSQNARIIALILGRGGAAHSSLACITVRVYPCSHFWEGGAAHSSLACIMVRVYPCSHFWEGGAVHS